MSDPGPSAADAGVRAAVRPFRLAAHALAGPLAPLEALLRAAERLPAALKLDLGMLDVAPFGSLAERSAEGSAPADERSGRVGGRRPARTPTARRSASGRAGPGSPASAPPRPAAEADAAGVQAPVAGTFGAASASTPGGSLLDRLADGALAAVPPAPGAADRGGERSRRRTEEAAPAAVAGEGSLLADLGPHGVADVVVPGTRAAVDAAAQRAADASLLEELAETALAAVGSSPAERGTPPGRQRSAGGESAAAGATPVPRPAAGERSSLAGLETRSLIEAVVPGSGESAVAAARSLAGASLLGELAETALAAVPPAPAASAAEGERPVLRQRSAGEEAVARALDGTQAASGSASRAPARQARPTREDGNQTVPVVQTAGAMAHTDLAWLVNEALVEQARRHGVDLS